MNKPPDETRWFDPRLIVEVERGRALIDAMQVAGEFGISAGLTVKGNRRIRKRRGHDEENRQAALRAAIANLAYSAVVLGGRPLKVPMDRQNTWHRERGSARVPGAIGLLERADLVEVHRSATRGTVSTIAPTARFLAVLTDALGSLDMILGCFATKPEDPARMIRYTRPAEDTWRRANSSKPDRYPIPSTVPGAARFCEEMRKINAAIAEGNIMGGPPGDPRRDLRRHFSLGDAEPQDCPPLNRNGRLFGGFWQTLPKADRLRLQIDGEPVAEVDYVSMFPRLAYVEAGHEPPEGDLYEGIEGDREGVKRVVSAMLSSKKPLTKFPCGTRSAFPSHLSIGDIRAAILSRHPPLAKVIERGMGPTLMFIESSILVAVLLRLLTGKGTVALPIHDSILVQRRHADYAARVMREEARRITGHALPVSIEGLEGE